MSEEEKKNGISRREFLKDAGLVVGGASVGSMAFLSACGSTKTETKTVNGPGVTTTQTVSKFVDPIDGTAWQTLDQLKAHFAVVRPMIALWLDLIRGIYVGLYRLDWRSGLSDTGMVVSPS